MNLPILNKLLENSSTYITFSKALVDYDYAIANKKEYYFSKCVALNLPAYKNPEFYIDLTSQGISNNNRYGPNMFLPKAIQFYMENIIRQKHRCENITELAFWKLLRKCGMSYDSIENAVVAINQIDTENFTYSETNNGWGEIVMSIPNASKKLIRAWKNTQIADVVVADVVNGNTDGLFDNSIQKEFNFSEPKAKQIIDFAQVKYDENTSEEFEFNTLLVFYKDHLGFEKLHGIYFIAPYENKVTEWVIPTYKQTTNDFRSIGYIFKLNVKTCNNEASLIQIQKQYNEAAHWSTYFDVMSKFNTFLESQPQIRP